MFPKEWQLCKIGDIAETTSGGTPSRKNKEYYDGNISWVKSGELEDCDIYSTEEKITEEALKKSSAKLFPKGTLLIAMYGATVGKTAMLRIDAATNQAVCAIFPKNKLTRAEFIRYFFIYARPTLLSHRYGGAQPNISQTVIRNFQIALPTLDEQQNIAHILSKIQSAIETQEKIIQTTAELKKALMQKLFTEGLKGEPQKETEIGRVPKSWELKKIKEICDIGTGGTPSTKINDYYSPPEINWLKSGDINGLYVTEVNNKISKLGKSNSNANTLFPHGSIMIAMSGRGKTRGTTAILKVESTCSQSVAAIVPKGQIISEFLHFSLSYRYNEIRNITGHTDRSGLNLGLIENIKVFLPSLEEQEKISKVFVTVEERIELAKTKQEILRNLFKSTLHHLMTGQIRVKDLRFS